jgi:quercetin dioxygenase-like cupin family protein
MTFDAAPRRAPRGRAEPDIADPYALGRPVAARDIPPAVVPGHSFRILAAGGATAGAYSVTEATSPQGAAVPAHAHDDAVECFYVLDGRYRITVGERTDEVGPGGFALVPRGAAHHFQVVRGEARAVVLFAPAGFEEVFRRMPEIFGTPGEPGPLWERANADAGTRLLAGARSGPPALIRPAGSPDGLAVLAGPEATRTRLSIALRTDTRAGASWSPAPSTVAAYVLAGRYRFERGGARQAVGAGDYLPLPAGPGPTRAVSLSGDSRVLLLRFGC